MLLSVSRGEVQKDGEEKGSFGSRTLESYTYSRLSKWLRMNNARIQYLTSYSVLNESLEMLFANLLQLSQIKIILAGLLRPFRWKKRKEA